MHIDVNIKKKKSEKERDFMGMTSNVVPLVSGHIMANSSAVKRKGKTSHPGCT